MPTIAASAPRIICCLLHREKEGRMIVCAGIERAGSSLISVNRQDVSVTQQWQTIDGFKAVNLVPKRLFLCIARWERWENIDLTCVCVCVRPRVCMNGRQTDKDGARRWVGTNVHLVQTMSFWVAFSASGGCASFSYLIFFLKCTCSESMIHSWRLP